eukprot:TRINITY_DN6223_c0_g1_i3.p1 TRINITY_DN6223_c0_g1~~TRINITY_DN6223_c0_g1_i3.p1  ORF type:complete len:634 (+),score=140.90 TRINITY_DN6223_c0_g1_i3:2622-4523(+)
MLRGVRSLRWTTSIDAKRANTNVSRIFYEEKKLDTHYFFGQHDQFRFLMHGQEPLYSNPEGNKQHYKSARPQRAILLPIETLHADSLDGFATYMLLQNIGRLCVFNRDIDTAAMKVVVTSFQRFINEMSLFSSNGMSFLCLIAAKLHCLCAASGARADVKDEALLLLREFVTRVVATMLEDVTFTTLLSAAACSNILIAMYICSVSHVRARHALYSRLLCSQVLQAMPMHCVINLLEYELHTGDLPPLLKERLFTGHELWHFSPYMTNSVILLWLCAVTTTQVPQLVVATTAKAIELFLGGVKSKYGQKTSLAKRQMHMLAVVMAAYGIATPKLADGFLKAGVGDPEMLVTTLIMLSDHLTPSNELQRIVAGIRRCTGFGQGVLLISSFLRLGFTAEASSMLQQVADFQGDEDISYVCKLLECAAIMGAQSTDGSVESVVRQVEYQVAARLDEVKTADMKLLASAMCHVPLHGVLQEAIVQRCQASLDPEEAVAVLHVLSLLPNNVAKSCAQNVFEVVLSNIGRVKSVAEVLVCWQRATAVGVTISHDGLDTLLRHIKPAMYGLPPSQLAEVLVYSANSEQPLTARSAKVLQNMANIIVPKAGELSLQMKSKLSWALRHLQIDSSLLEALRAV